jgi:RNA polymerase sigma factor (sigma-70 family)
LKNLYGKSANVASNSKTTSGLQSNKSHSHLSDQELMQHFKASGNNLYIGILLERYSLLLFGVCMKYLKNEEEAKDAVQQVFAKAIPELKKYHVEYVKSWLYMIARNYCLMQLRNKHINIPAEWAENRLADDKDPLLAKQAMSENAQLMELTEQGLQQLPEPQNKCVTLFYLSKKSYQQITESTGYSLLQVKSHIQNGKRNIKLWVEKKMKQNAS